MKFKLVGKPVAVIADFMINAGYAGCNQAVVKTHIEELAQIGVDVPKRVPTFYPVPALQLTQASTVQVGHGNTSAEIEYVFIRSGGSTYLTVGSDHSDRALETYSVCAAKQICPNVVADELWLYEEVIDHFDKLRMVCEVGEEDGSYRIYQDGYASEILMPEKLLALGREAIPENQENVVLYSGTIPTIGEITYGTKWRITMTDEKLNRSISFTYEVAVLPDCIE